MDCSLLQGTYLHHKRYRIESTIAQGGFGITYLAFNQDNKKVVIKEFYKDSWHNRNTSTSDITIYDSFQDVENMFRKKFLKEAQTIMKLKHPNIVKVYDFFEEHGTLYYVMEFIDGCSLSDYVKKNGKLTETRSLQLIKKVANTLGYIHSQNELHLDITPRNIMLTKEGNIKLIDFGVSKHYDDNGDQSTMTPVARSKGYAPVEQYISEGMMKFSPETDIYALAATLYFLLTATTPPDANDRQHFLEEGRDLLNIPTTLSDNVKDALKFGMYISRKWRLKNTEQFLSTVEGTYKPEEPPENTILTQIHSDVTDKERQLIETLKKNKQYKDAYDICLDMIQSGKSIDYAQKECDNLIPYLKKKQSKDKNTLRVVIIIAITIAFLSMILTFLSMYNII